MYYRRVRKYTENNIQNYLPAWIASGCKNKFYGLALWTEKRNKIMTRDRCLCQDCLARGVITQADVVHHIQFLDVRPDLALEDSNLISLCKFCHKVRHYDLWQVLGRWDDNYPAWVPRWMYDLAQARRAAREQPPMQTQPGYPTQPIQPCQPTRQPMLSNKYQNYQQQSGTAGQADTQQYPYPYQQYSYQPQQSLRNPYQQYNPYAYQPYNPYSPAMPGAGG